MNRKKFSEAELRAKFIASIRESNRVSVYAEVPVFNRSVDLVLQRLDTNEITAIEFKLHDWRRAIVQAQSVDLCFDYLSICLPCPRTPTGEANVVATCRENGVGLYFYDSDKDIFFQSVESQKTTSIWMKQKERVVCYLEAKKNESSVKNT